MDNYSRTKAFRILYIVIAGVLCIAAAVTGILIARNRQTKPEPISTVAKIDPPKEDPVPADTLPVFVAPISGTVAKRHDPDVPVYSATMQEFRVHCGIDVEAPVGTPVCAVADGTVSEVYDHPMLGKCVKVSHGGDAVSVYCNLSQDLAQGITVGSSVRCGQTIGCVGETTLIELADEPHLHFEMTVAGASVDPLDMISEASQAASFSMTDDAYEF